jgi:hypothetical protein
VRYGATLLGPLLVLAACTAGPGPQYTIQRLPSGKAVKVIGVMKMHFSKGEPALMLTYQTDLRIDDAAALRQEVEEIWPVFRVNVEQAQLGGAVISAREAPTGLFIKKSRGHNFIVARDEAGAWAFR